jgi:O-antigen/teichoic acid export membrane protein
MTSTSPSATVRASSALAILRERLSAALRTGGERAQAQRDALLAFGVRVTSAGLLYASQVALARWMGSFDYGIYVFVWTWVLILGGLSPLGLTNVTVRMVAEYRAKGADSLRRGLVRGGRLFVLSIGTAVALIGILGLWIFESHVQSHYVLPVYLAMICIPLYALTDIQDGVARGHGWVDAAIIPPFIVRPLLILLIMAGAYMAGLPMRATTAAAAAIAAVWIAGLIQTFVINRRLRRLATDRHADYDFSRWLVTAAPLFVMGSAELILQNADILIISRYMTPEDVGIYFAAAKTMALILFVHYAVGSTAAQRFSSLNTQGDRDALKAFVRDAVNWTFWPSLAGAAVILALGGPLLSLFGPRFETGYPVMFVLVIGYLLRSAMGPVEQLLNMLGEQRLCAIVLVATLAVNLTLNILLVPRLGLMGAACATATALSLSAFVNAAIAHHRLGISVAIWKNIRRR